MRVLNKLALQLKKPDGFLGRLTAGMMIKRNSSVYVTLINKMNIMQGEKLFEIGYGPGFGIELIMGSYNPATLSGVDYSELMYKSASKRNNRFICDGKVKLYFGDFIDAEIAQKEFDKVYFTNVVYFWNNLQKPFTKIYSLLRIGGSVYFFMAGKDYLEKQKITSGEVFNKYSIEQISAALKFAGFSKIEWTFDNGYYVHAEK